jgi:hypothetical protein
MIDENYIIRVVDFMKLPKPTKKSNIIKNYDEKLPIILIDTGGIT